MDSLVNSVRIRALAVEDIKSIWKAPFPFFKNWGKSRTHTSWLAFLCFTAATTLVLSASAQTVSGAPILQPGRVSAGTVLLPNGWKVSPAGAQIPVGGFPLRVVTVPHTDLAISTSNGYSEHFLSLIDLSRHRVVQRMPIADGWMGLAVTGDGKTVYASSGAGDSILVFHLDGTHLSPDGKISLPVDTFPAGITLNADASRLFIAGNLSNSMLVVDAASRKVLFSGSTGRKPYACALVPKHHAVYVSNWGEDNLSILDMNDGHLIARLQVREKPGDILTSPDGGRVFVTNGDRNIVSIIDTEKQRVSEEIDTSLNRTPLAGSTPDGLALSADGRTLFVANANNNSVAVVDVAAPLRSAVLGFIPSGWFPAAVAVAGEGKEQRLVIANAKGNQSYENESKWTPRDGAEINPNPGYVGRVLQGTVSVVPFTALRQLPLYTREVRRNSPFITPVPASAPPFPLGRSGPIQHVIYIIKENRTYDQVLGDMPEGNGEASYAIFGSQVTPNQHKIARQFTLIDNLYHNAEVSATGHFWVNSAISSEYVEKLWPSSYSGRGGRKRVEYHEDADDFPASGFIWDECARKGISYRSYGEFGRGSDPGKVQPTMASLQDHLSPAYRGADVIASFSDLERYTAWKSEFDSYVKQGSLPTFEVLSLPGDHTVGTRPGAQTPRAMVAENDLVLAKMIDDISHSPFWKDTAIFVIEDDAQNGPDHVDCHRTTAFVVSPYVRRHFVDHTMYSAVSIVRTMELLLGLPPMTQYDSAATPMWSLFQGTPDLTPFIALPAQISIEERNTSKSYGAALSLRMPLDAADEADDGQLNEILWKSVRGADAQMPSRRLDARLIISPAAESAPPHRHHIFHLWEKK